MKIKKRYRKLRVNKKQIIKVICDYCGKEYEVTEQVYYAKMRQGFRYFFCSEQCLARARAEYLWNRKAPVNIPDELKEEPEVEVSLIPGDMQGFCYYCHRRIPKSAIFCEEHATKEHLAIFEATQELPVHPRGWWSYEIIKDWLSGYKKILLKAPSGTGKSVLEDIMAYLNLTLFDNSFTLIGSISMPIAVQHIDRIRSWVAMSPFRNLIVYDSKEQIKLKNGSRVLAIAQNEKTRGGYHPDLILLDELARIRPSSYYGLFYQMGKTKGATEIGVSTPFLSCYDDQTEVLTENGFKLFKDVDLNEKVATMNLDTEQLEFQYPLEKQVYDYDGYLISLNTKGINLNVTPNHRIYYIGQWAFRNKKKSYKSCRADQLLPEYCIHIPKVPLPTEGKDVPYLRVQKNVMELRNGHGAFKKVDKAFDLPMDLWLEFLGYFLSEGSVEKKGRIKISQKKFKDRMFKCCKQIATYFHRKGEEGQDYFRIQSPQLYKLLKGEKRIPDYVFGLSLRQRKIFLDAFSLGDGSQQSRKYNEYMLFLNYPKEKALGDDLQRLLITMGIPTIARVKKGNGSCLVISGNSKRYADLRKREEGKDISRKYYKGKVYCCTVPNHTLIVRRKGKVSISGNSGPFLKLWYSGTARNYAVKLEDCWFITEEMIRDAQKDMSPSFFDQVFKAEFVATSNRVIPDEQLLNAITDTRSKYTGETIMGLDFGRKRDHTALVVLNDKGHVIYTEILPLKTTWREQYAIIRDRTKKFNPTTIYADQTSIGDPILEELSDLPIEPVLMSNDKLKKKIIDNLVLCFAYNSIHIPKDEQKLIDQLSAFVYLDDNLSKCGPEGGAHDDLVDALALASLGLERHIDEEENTDSWGAIGGEQSLDVEESPWTIVW